MRASGHLPGGAGLARSAAHGLDPFASCSCSRGETWATPTARASSARPDHGRAHHPDCFPMRWHTPILHRLGQSRPPSTCRTCCIPFISSACTVAAASSSYREGQHVHRSNRRCCRHIEAAKQPLDRAVVRAKWSTRRRRASRESGETGGRTPSRQGTEPRDCLVSDLDANSYAVRRTCYVLRTTVSASRTTSAPTRVPRDEALSSVRETAS
jgi:hypothetical protein